MPTMFTLPWRWIRRPGPGQTVLFASRFDAASPRAGWRLLWGGIKLRRAVVRSPGALGVSLRAHPLRGRYYTVSMWHDEASLQGFARGREHADAVRRMRELGPIGGILISRPSEGRRPRWRDTRRWVDGAEPGPYRGGVALPVAD